MSSSNFDFLFKYIIIGDAAVGKSNILLKYAHNQFKPEYQLTIGVEFGAKNIVIQNKIYRIQIWDTAGQENFRSITRAYYKNSVCAVIVYDISNKESFDNVSIWVEDCRSQSPKTISLVLVGNKKDLEDQREVSYEKGEEFAKANGMLFFEVSAKTGQNINELFKESAEDIAKKLDSDYYDTSNESCGIKIGIKKEMKSGSNMFRNGNDIGMGTEKKKCC